MADIVLDANALRLLLCMKYVEKVKERCCHIYISKKWKKVYKGIRDLHIGFQTLLFSIKNLRKKNKLHEVSTTINLPPNIDRELKRKGASEDDFEISQIAYSRSRKSGHKVFLVSDYHHITQLYIIFQQHGVVIEKMSDELKRLGVKCLGLSHSRRIPHT